MNFVYYLYYVMNLLINCFSFSDSIPLDSSSFLFASTICLSSERKQQYWSTWRQALHITPEDFSITLIYSSIESEHNYICISINNQYISKIVQRTPFIQSFYLNKTVVMKFKLVILLININKNNWWKFLFVTVMSMRTHCWVWCRGDCYEGRCINHQSRHSL